MWEEKLWGQSHQTTSQKEEILQLFFKSRITTVHGNAQLYSVSEHFGFCLATTIGNSNTLADSGHYFAPYVM